VVDTLKRADGNSAARPWTAPDCGARNAAGLRFAPILAAHRMAASGPEMTDDAAVAEAAGNQVVLVPGIVNNFKVTTKADFERAEHMMAERRASHAWEYVPAAAYDVQPADRGRRRHLVRRHHSP